MLPWTGVRFPSSPPPRRRKRHIACGDFFTKVPVRSFCCVSLFAKRLATLPPFLRVCACGAYISRFLYRKHGCACQAAAPLSQKTYRFFGSPVFILQSSLCFDVLFFKERLRLLPCFSFSQKVLRLFGSPVRLAATFLQKSPCAHFAAAPLSRKIVRFFTSLRLRRVFYFVVRFASTFFFSKNVYACSLASPFPKKSYDFSGALPALCVWGGGGQTQQGGR